MRRSGDSSRTCYYGLLFRQGVPPQASYLFKHALLQDAAYGTLLRDPRRALHARIAEILESQFTEIASNYLPLRASQSQIWHLLSTVLLMPTGIAGAPLHTGGHQRHCYRMVGQGR